MDAFTRTKPPRVGPEKEMTTAFLDYHRTTLLLKIQDLSDEAARQTVPPSSMSLMGLIKHLAYVERWWFHWVFAGDEVEFPWTEADPDAEWRVAEADTLASVAAFYQTECDRSRQIVTAAKLDDLAQRPPDDEPLTLRNILLHMLEETARHNGHADILRESIDGVTGL